MAGGLGIYRVWIANLAAPDSNNRWSAAARKDACDFLRELFNRVIADPACKFTHCDWFLFEPRSSVVAQGEVLLYILASSRYSIINKMQSGQQINPDFAGNTFDVRGSVISEIYLGAGPHNPGSSRLTDSDYTQLIANLAFHELMHNKLDALPLGKGGVVDDIHLADGSGLSAGAPGAKPLSSKTPLTPTNIKFMAPNLARPVPQFTRGVTDLVISNGMPSMVDNQPAPTP